MSNLCTPESISLINVAGFSVRPHILYHQRGFSTLRFEELRHSLACCVGASFLAAAAAFVASRSSKKSRGKVKEWSSFSEFNKGSEEGGSDIPPREEKGGLLSWLPPLLPPPLHAFLSPRRILTRTSTRSIVFPAACCFQTSCFLACTHILHTHAHSQHTHAHINTTRTPTKFKAEAQFSYELIIQFYIYTVVIL